MPATAEPTASFPDMRPRTVHDTQNQILDVYVSVTKNPAGGIPLVAAPSLAVLKGGWTLIWTLVVDDGLNAQFAKKPIEIDPSVPVPPRVTFPIEKIENFGSYCTGPLRNDVNGANHFRYYLNVECTLPSSVVPIVIHHDPTIAVTPDPITTSCQKPIG